MKLLSLASIGTPLCLVLFFFSAGSGVIGSTTSTSSDETELDYHDMWDQEVEEEDLPLEGHYLSGDHDSLLTTDNFECQCDHSSNCRNVHDTVCVGARLFYLIGIHNHRTLHDAIYLFRGIRDPRNTILIHIDKKFKMEHYENSALKQEIEACPCGSKVEVASVYDAAWGSWSMVSPTLWAIERAVEDYSGQWDVFINLSGDTLPVYSPDHIADLFEGPLKNTNFITSSACETGLLPTPITYFDKKWHKRGHYSQHPMSLDFTDHQGVEHTNTTFEIHFGSQWMSLLPEWCLFLTNEMKRPSSLPCQFRDYLIKTKKLMTDETFIPTLIMHLFPDTVPKLREDSSLDSTDVHMTSIRYERMDEHAPNSKGVFPTGQRYDVPHSTGVDIPKPWGPYYLGVYDLDAIRSSGALFIRKVATAIDHNLFHLLPVDSPKEIPAISWPRELKIIEKPDWEKKLAEMKKKYKEKQKKEKSQQKEGAPVKIDVKPSQKKAMETNKKGAKDATEEM